MTNVLTFRTLYVEKDGALAWVICFCALINNAIVNGIDCSFGVILASVMKKLNSSASTVSWIASIHTSCMFLFAWISTILTQKFGFRLVITFGVIISCLACASFLDLSSNALCQILLKVRLMFSLRFSMFRS